MNRLDATWLDSTRYNALCETFVALGPLAEYPHFVADNVGWRLRVRAERQAEITQLREREEAFRREVASGQAAPLTNIQMTKKHNEPSSPRVRKFDSTADRYARLDRQRKREAAALAALTAGIEERGEQTPQARPLHAAASAGLADSPPLPVGAAA